MEIGVELEFIGEGIIQKCSKPDFQLEIGAEVIKIDERYFHPTEVDLLMGDPTKSKKQLGWKPKYDVSSYQRNDGG